VIHFGKKNKLQKYHLNNLPQKEVTQERDLGITVTSDLIEIISAMFTGI